MRSRAGMWAAVLAVAGALGSVGVARADTVTVNETGDGSGTCPDTCTLRAAVASAQSGDTITFKDPGTYDVTQGTSIVLSRAVTIDGGAPGRVTVFGGQNVGSGGTHRIFTAQARTIRLQNVTLTGAHNVIDHCCSTIDEDGGGALFVPAGQSAAVSHVEFTGNVAFVGSAVSSAGDLTIADSYFHGDGGSPFGSGIAAKGGTLTIDRSTLQAEQGGPAIFIYGNAVATVTNSTVTESGLPSGRGGGVTNGAGTLTLVNDTLAGNERGSLTTLRGATTKVENTIVADGFSDGDADCVAAGLPASDGTTAPAVTVDLGHNLDQDGSCGLSAANGDRPGADPRLVPLADNGGPVPTQALIHDSAALGAGDPAACPVIDARGTARKPQCDLGAFETVKLGRPTAATGDATDVGATSAALSATVGLAGEAGGAHFEWGTSPAFGHTTAELAVPGGGAGTVLDGLRPNTTYYFRAVADNATASGSGDTKQFTTSIAPPTVSGGDVSRPTDTTAVANFSLDPGGADTTYKVEYGTDALNQTSATFDAGAVPATFSVPLTGLQPDTQYSYLVVATNSAGSTVDDPTHSFTTAPQVRGNPDQELSVTDSGAFDGCPQRATIDWGDGSAPTPATPDCNPDDGTFATTSSHAYQRAGRYDIRFDYGGAVDDVFARIGSVLTLSVSGPGAVTDSDGTTLCADIACAVAFAGGTLKPSPTAGALFRGWSGDCDGSGDCQPDPGGDHDASAEFAGPPVISPDVGEDPVDDTSATLHFTVDPNGGKTTSVVHYGTTPSYGESTAPVDLGRVPGEREESVDLAGLQPGTAYYFRIATTSDASPAVTTREGRFTTAPRAGAPVVGGPQAAPTVSGAAISFTLDPGGTPTQYEIDYGPTAAYGQRSGPFDAGSGAGAQTFTQTLNGLQPGQTYHYRVVATNANGSMDTGDRTFTTAAQQQATPTPTPTPTATPTPNPTPVFHQDVVVRPISGTVLVRLKGTHTFVPLDAKAGVPLGSQVDVTHGRIALTSVPRRGGKPQTAQFYAGIFTVTQPGAITQLTLSGPKPTCAPAHGHASAAAAKKKVKTRKLWGDGHGSFRTSGRYSAATVRGTQWLVQDTCAGTLTRVAHGLVAVTDRVRHRTILVRGGTSYLARPR